MLFKSKAGAKLINITCLFIRPYLNVRYSAWFNCSRNFAGMVQTFLLA